MDTDQLSNHLQVATMAQFWRYDQSGAAPALHRALLRAVGDIWRTRTMDTAHTITEMLFPAVVIEQATVDRTIATWPRRTPSPPCAGCSARAGTPWRGRCGRAPDAETG